MPAPPSLCVILSRGCSDKEIAAVVDRLPGIGGDFAIHRVRMSDSYWRHPWLRGRRYWAAQAADLCLRDGDRVTFVTLAPDFLRGQYQRQSWTLELDLGQLYGEETLVCTFPTADAVADKLDLWTYQTGRTSLSGGHLVTDESVPAVPMTVKLPSAHELISVILDDAGFKISTSKPGRITQAIIRKMGTVQFGCRMFKLRAVQNVTNHVNLSRGKPVVGSELRRVVKKGLTECPPEQAFGYAPECSVLILTQRMCLTGWLSSV